MKRLIDLNNDDARAFLIKEECYSNIDLPYYFSFNPILKKLSKKLDGKNLKDFRSDNPRDFDDVNYKLLSNKDGKYAWRPFQLINPAIYISLVHKITEEENWKLIQERFKKFQNEKKIECHSLPVLSESDKKTDKTAQILTWWEMIEQRSLVLSLDYKYVMHTDISDCYSSIYTHSIPWAIHKKVEAKKKANRTKNSLIGVAIDNHLQDMSFGQTNGIPQGSTTMDFIAEIVLGYVDLLLANKLAEVNITNYRILRYRDDYRIFTNNPFESEQITKELSEILTGLGLKLNADKTEASEDIIKSSIKPDKRYWISNRRIAESKQKWLIQIYLLSDLYPNSGTVDTQMREFLKVLEGSKKKDSQLETLISLVTEIAIRNPRVVPISMAILSIFLNRIKINDEKVLLVKKIKMKFNQIPNSSFIKVWSQRLYMKIEKDETYDEPLCNSVINENQKIWNCEWLDNGIKDIIEGTTIVKKEKVEKTKSKMSKKEIKKIIIKKSYYE
ncbi:RNA-directed DNA polymerase [Aquimarina latercula]|uniref:RNA-directed DNA polymerase n=1 Tax=Aquimarina latercula TaxID=987 RepID=UPI00041CFB73|nr:RNA-directed DNA polymerase [Aquimarina latercula]